MSDEIWEIVITGGACSGKTTSLARLPEILAEHQISVLVVPEIATLLMSAGMPIAHITANDPEGLFHLEREMILMMGSLRERYLGLARIIGGKVVIFYDRAEMDCCAYIGKEKFEQIMTAHNLAYDQVRDSYDRVIHLVSTAVDAPAFYSKDNNPNRFESPEEAVASDRRGLEAWTGANLVVIDNSTDFEGKLARVEQEVLKTIGVLAPISNQRKFLLAAPADYNQEPLKSSPSFAITNTYLRSDSADTERSIRSRRHQEQETYFYTVKRPAGDGLRRETIEARISFSEYKRLLGDADQTRQPIRKQRHVITHDNLVFRLDRFLDFDLSILEVEMTEGKELFTTPDGIMIDKEVTNDPHYRTHALASRV